MRTCIALATLGILIATAAPVLGQDLPVNPPVGVPEVPAAPQLPADPGAVDVPSLPWVGLLDGVPYHVVDGAVSRVDGAKPDADAVREIQLAKRASDLLADHPDFPQVDPSGVQSLADENLAPVDGALSRIEGLLATLPTDDLTGLDLGSLLGGAPIDTSQVDYARYMLQSKLAEARAHSAEAQAASDRVKSTVAAFESSHSVEDKLAMFDAFHDAIPAYQKAAAQAADVRARANALAAEAQDLASRLDAKVEGLLFGPLPTLPHSLDEAANQLRAAAYDAENSAHDYDSDVAFMQSMLTEPVEDALPVGWIIGGGAGLVAAGAGTLWWLRRRIGVA